MIVWLPFYFLFHMFLKSTLFNAWGAVLVLQAAFICGNELHIDPCDGP